jgi:lipoprotein-anchoring transpeptidase ErfK/SrfK
MKLPIVLASSVLLAILPSCSNFSGHQTALRHVESRATTPAPVDGSASPEADYSYWEDSGVDGPLRIRIDLSDQTADFYRGGTKIGRSRVATGRAGHSTPTGNFTIMEKVAGKRSNLYGRIYDANGNLMISDADTRRHSIPTGGSFRGAPMPYWMRLTSHGIGLHVGAIPNPGSPASHGCVRMPREMARVLFENAPTGTPVTIVH